MPWEKIKQSQWLRQPHIKKKSTYLLTHITAKPKKNENKRIYVKEKKYKHMAELNSEGKKKKVSKAEQLKFSSTTFSGQEARLPHPVLSTIRFKQP